MADPYDPSQHFPISYASIPDLAVYPTAYQSHMSGGLRPTTSQALPTPGESPRRPVGDLTLPDINAAQLMAGSATGHLPIPLSAPSVDNLPRASQAAGLPPGNLVAHPQFQTVTSSTRPDLSFSDPFGSGGGVPGGSGHPAFSTASASAHFTSMPTGYLGHPDFKSEPAQLSPGAYHLSFSSTTATLASHPLSSGTGGGGQFDPASHSGGMMADSMTRQLMMMGKPPGPENSVAPLVYPSHLQFRSYLESKVSPACRRDEPAVTYINRGQTYSLCHGFHQPTDRVFKAQVVITFHEEHHRREAERLWRVWAEKQLGQQSPRVVEIDLAASVNITVVDDRYFDRISFTWRGPELARVALQFNFLSTDFTNLKGIKGIPLRLVVQSWAEPGHQAPVETNYALLKSFRDKGAERKYKDETRQFAKLYSNPQRSSETGEAADEGHYPRHSFTVFNQSTSPTEVADPLSVDLLIAESSPIRTTARPIPWRDKYMGSPEYVSSSLKSPRLHHGRPHAMHPPHQLPPPPPSPLTSTTHHLRGADRPIRPCQCQVTDRDPTYYPNLQRKYLLCLYVQFSGDDFYRAVYLERVSADHLRHQLSIKMGYQPGDLVEIRRQTERGHVVALDDDAVRHMDDEQAMAVEVRSLTTDPNRYTVTLYY